MFGVKTSKNKGYEWPLVGWVKQLTIGPKMPYIQETCIAGPIKEIRKYHTYRYNQKGEKRLPQVQDTTECQKKVNQREAQRRLRRLINANFKDGDYLITGDFRKDERPPNSEALQKIMEDYIRRLRYRFKKAGQELKYIYVKELGKKGACHFHMVITECPVKWLRECWPYGGIHIDPLYSGKTEGYGQIADYFTKYYEKTIDTEGALIGKRWYGSRNLVKPVVTKKIITAGTFRKTVKPEKGYRILDGTYFYGVSEVTGYEMLSYSMIRDG